MTPQAGRVPALPVFLDSSLPPWPRSSVPEWTTTVRPITLSGPINLMSLSVVEPLPFPWPSVSKLPKSPTWRVSSWGAPWVFPWGLKWGPADVQPLVLSPNWWTCMPRLAFGSLPLMSHVMVVGELSESCSKVTVPEIFESPRTVATVKEERHD